MSEQPAKPLSEKSRTQRSRQHGSALVLGLVILLVITVSGVAAVGQGLMQRQMAGQYDESAMAFEAAEAGIEAVIHEQEGKMISELDRALSEARQLAPWNMANELRCFSSDGVLREVASTGLLPASKHSGDRQLSAVPPVHSWSRTAFIGEDPFLLKGGEAESVDNEMAFHAFLIRGCGQSAGSPVAAANTLTVSVLGPRTGI